MTKEEVKAKIDELLRQYDNEEINREEYWEKMMDLTSSLK